MPTDMHVLQSAGMILLDVPAEQADSILARLDQFFRGRADRAGRPRRWRGCGCTVRARRQSWRRSSGVDGLGDWSDYRHSTGTFEDGPVSVARIDQLGVPCYAFS